MSKIKDNAPPPPYSEFLVGQLELKVDRLEKRLSRLENKQSAGLQHFEKKQEPKQDDKLIKAIGQQAKGYMDMLRAGEIEAGAMDIVAEDGKFERYYITHQPISNETLYQVNGKEEAIKQFFDEFTLFSMRQSYPGINIADVCVDYKEKLNKILEGE